MKQRFSEGKGPAGNGGNARRIRSGSPERAAAMKKAVSVFLCAVLAFALPFPSFAGDAHEHAGPLEALSTEEGSEIPCCGIFRCAECGETYEATVTPADVGMPIMELEGSLDGISKENKVTVTARCNDGAGVAFESRATLKWQGGVSVEYPKKNYNIQFLKDNGSKNKVELNGDWGKQSKYTLKANWVDPLGARNLVSAKLWGEVVHSRCRDDRLNGLLNGGAVDGYPVLLYHNGDFQGLYTLNMPKDEWIFGMDDETAREGLLFGETWSDSVMLQSRILNTGNTSSSGWEVEYCSTEDDPDVGIGWLGDGMNRLIVFLKNNDGEALRAGLGNYTDVDRCIDYMLYILFICAGDNLGKNTLWVTYDGVKYIPSAYDLDGTWGMLWNGSFPDMREEWSTFSKLRGNLLFERLLDNYADEIAARYLELRENVLSLANVKRLFTEFLGGIPAIVRDADALRWPAAPCRAQNTLTQILTFAEAHIADLDALFRVTVEEKAESAYRAAFVCENGAKVYVYPTQDTGTVPVRAATAFSVNGSTGELTKTDGQINFKIEAPEGYTAAVEITPADGYNKLKTPEDTGAENVWRITKIKKDLTVRVRLVEGPVLPGGFNVTFVCDPGVDVWVYPGADYTAAPEKTNAAVSVDSGTGAPTRKDGQVNFKLTGLNPLDAFQVSVAPKNYKNLKDSRETGQTNTWRVTKITGDITVYVKLIAHTHSWSGWTLITPPTEETPGVDRRVCACGAEETRPVHWRPVLIPGDADGDEAVTAGDARLALRRAVDLETWSAGSPDFIACDIDKDGKVTAADARIILRVAVELESAEDYR